jgi:hypothetical protein
VETFWKPPRKLPPCWKPRLRRPRPRRSRSASPRPGRCRSRRGFLIVGEVPSVPRSIHSRFGDGLGCPSSNREYRDRSWWLMKRVDVSLRLRGAGPTRRRRTSACIGFRLAGDGRVLSRIDRGAAADFGTAVSPRAQRRARQHERRRRAVSRGQRHKMGVRPARGPAWGTE